VKQKQKIAGYSTIPWFLVDSLGKVLKNPLPGLKDTAFRGVD
jgi:hypothetical protein